jgi:hypothetical protein
MKKKGFLLVMLAMVLAFGLVLVGCDNGSTSDSDDNGGGGKTLTFKLTPVSDNNFTVTVSGGKWPSEVRWDQIYPAFTGYSGDSVIIRRTSDTVLTFTIIKTITSGSGTVTLSSGNVKLLGQMCLGYQYEDPYECVVASDSGIAIYI